MEGLKLTSGDLYATSRDQAGYRRIKVDINKFGEIKMDIVDLGIRRDIERFFE